MIPLFLSFAITLAAAQQQTSVPASPTPVQETVKRQPLTSSEISRLRTKAESGDADAENALGTMYRMGEGVPKDRDEALRWYHKATRDGSAAAMFNLGAAYYNGDGVNIDDVTSCAWFLLAQEAGYPHADDAVNRATSENAARPIQAAQKIGEMYEKGGDLPKNPDKALKWYRKAADGGAPEAAVNAAGLLVNGRNPTPEEFAEARKHCEDAANLHYSAGAYCMAVIYRAGLGVAKDPAETAKWLMRAADLGHPKAVLQLGEAYWKADGVKPDPVTAYMWILLAYRSRVPGAEQDEEEIRKEMSAKDIEKAKKKADAWALQHRILVVRTTPTSASSQSQ